MDQKHSKPSKISLLLADVDGTLLDSKKRITPRAAAAIEKLAGAGIGFAITSGRPPRGLRAVSDKVKVTAPIAAFNGGTLIRPDTFEIIESLTLPRDVAERVIARLGQLGLDVWVYAGLEWYLRNPDAPHRAKEESNVQFAPTVVADFSAALEAGVAKIVGVSNDLDLVARVEKMAQEEFAGTVPSKPADASRPHDPVAVAVRSVTAERSQPFYLDVTHPDANKGRVVEMLARTQKIPSQQIATIGDMPNDVLMFVKSGFPIAMGQASDEVKNFASRVTTSLDDEGFARAVEDFILGAASS
jgi:HAD superfamily hydrolase (TIGR01484 family)